jgi:hypothetical protein
MSNVIPYLYPNLVPILVFTIPSALISILFLFDSARTHRAERKDFREKVVHEALDILDRLVSTSTYEIIAYSVWHNKTEEFKKDALDEAYDTWKKFYDSIEARNGYLSSRQGFDAEYLQIFNRSCHKTFFEVHDKIAWVYESIPQTRIDSLRYKIKRNALL